MECLSLTNILNYILILIGTHSTLKRQWLNHAAFGGQESPVETKEIYIEILFLYLACQTISRDLQVYVHLSVS